VADVAGRGRDGVRDGAGSRRWRLCRASRRSRQVARSWSRPRNTSCSWIGCPPWTTYCSMPSAARPPPWRRARGGAPGRGRGQAAGSRTTRQSPPAARGVRARVPSCARRRARTRRPCRRRRIEPRLAQEMRVYVRYHRAPAEKYWRRQTNEVTPTRQSPLNPYAPRSVGRGTRRRRGHQPARSCHQSQACCGRRRRGSRRGRSRNRRRCRGCCPSSIRAPHRNGCRRSDRRSVPGLSRPISADRGRTHGPRQQSATARRRR
jgi:hypothetical protein